MYENIYKYLDKDSLKFDISNGSNRYYFIHLVNSICLDYRRDMNLSFEKSKLTNEDYIRLGHISYPYIGFKVGMFMISVSYKKSDNVIKICSRLSDRESDVYDLNLNFMKIEKSIDTSIFDDKFVSLSDILLFVFEFRTELLSILSIADIMSRPYLLNRGPMIRLEGRPQKSYQILNLEDTEHLMLSNFKHYFDIKLTSECIIPSLYSVVKNVCDSEVFSSITDVKLQTDKFIIDANKYKLVIDFDNSQAHCDIKFVGAADEKDVDSIYSQTIIVDDFNISQNLLMKNFLDYATRLIQIIKFVDNLNHDVLEASDKVLDSSDYNMVATLYDPDVDLENDVKFDS